MSLLTDQIQATGVTLNDLVHIVVTGDTSQNPAGSSFKANIEQVAVAIGTAAFSGGTVVYPTAFISGLTANTFYATTYLNLPGSSNGNCLSDFYVSNIHSCSPLYINPLDEGDVVFGQSNQVYFDLSNKRVGLNTIPVYDIDALGSLNGRLFYRNTPITTGFNLSGTSASVSSFDLFAGINGLQIAVFGQDSTTIIGSVVSNDIYVGTNSSSDNLVFNTQPGASLQKNIKFFAGKNPDTKPDMTIVGTGATRGFVGVAMSNPQVEFHVDGDSIINNGLTASTLNLSTTPVTQTSVPTNHLTIDDTTGEIKIDPAYGPINYGLFSQTGDSVVISATTTESTLIDGGVGTLTVPENSFKIGDSFRVVMGGMISAANNETLRIRIKAGSVILGDSGTQILPTISNAAWILNVNFTIRNIGSAGVASIVSLSNFTYTKNTTGTIEGFSFNTVNSTTFDTTISNTLEITAQWGSTNASNVIYSDFFNLNKSY